MIYESQIIVDRMCDFMAGMNILVISNRPPMYYFIFGNELIVSLYPGAQTNPDWSEMHHNNLIDDNV